MRQPYVDVEHFRDIQSKFVLMQSKNIYKTEVKILQLLSRFAQMP